MRRIVLWAKDYLFNVHLNYFFRLDTYFDWLPSIRYRWPLSVHTHNFPHFLDSWIGRHQIIKGQLILIVNPADIATPSDLPKDQAERVHISPLERVEVVHVYRLFKNLKAENVCTSYWRAAFLIECAGPLELSSLIIIIFPCIFTENYFTLKYLCQ